MDSPQFKCFLICQVEGLSNRQKCILCQDIYKYPDKPLLMARLTRKGCLNSQQQSSLLKVLEVYQSEPMTSYRLIKANPCLTIGDVNYPGSLKESDDPPPILFYQGDINLLKTPCLAMVGSRHPSDYGRGVVRKIIPDLVAANLTLVSGLAKGIDTAVHLETLKQGGKTIAVLGSGLSVYYPKENERLQKELASDHLIISEYLRDQPPRKWQFPARNRIIANLSLGTCVIEARSASGSLITAEQAINNGREVFAIPGSILTNRSQGCHDLIQDGAKCVTHSNDIFTELEQYL